MNNDQASGDDFRAAETLRRKEINLRSQLRTLDTRERSVLFVLTGIYLYTALGNAMLVFGMLTMGLWPRAWFGIVIGSVTAIACIVAVFKMWLPKPAHIWIVAMPCAINLVVLSLFGLFVGLAFALNLVAAAFCFALYRTWRSQAVLRTQRSKLQNDLAVVETA